MASFALASLSTPAFAQSDQPSDPVAEEFKAACSGVNELSAVFSAIDSNGWSTAHPTSDHVVSHYLAAMEDFVIYAFTEPNWVELQVFAKSIGDREVYLLVEEVELPNSTKIVHQKKCTVLDFNKGIPTLESLGQVIGQTRSSMDHKMPIPSVDGFGGVAWAKGFGIEGASWTSVDVHELSATGAKVLRYSARRDYFAPEETSYEEAESMLGSLDALGN